MYYSFPLRSQYSAVMASVGAFIARSLIFPLSSRWSAQAAHRRRIQAFAADRHVRPVLCGHVRRRDVVVEGIGCLGSFLVGLPDLLGGPPLRRNSDTDGRNLVFLADFQLVQPLVGLGHKAFELFQSYVLLVSQLGFTS